MCIIINIWLLRACHYIFRNLAFFVFIRIVSTWIVLILVVQLQIEFNKLVIGLLNHFRWSVEFRWCYHWIRWCSAGEHPLSQVIDSWSNNMVSSWCWWEWWQHVTISLWAALTYLKVSDARTWKSVNFYCLRCLMLFYTSKSITIGVLHGSLILIEVGLGGNDDSLSLFHAWLGDETIFTLIKPIFTLIIYVFIFVFSVFEVVVSAVFSFFFNMISFLKISLLDDLIWIDLLS